MIQQLLTLAKPYATQVLFFALYLLTIGLLGHKTQIAEWVERHPKVSFVVRALRSVGPDPALFLKALREYARTKARLPPSLPVSILVCFACAPLLSGCFGSLEETRGEIRIGAPRARASGTCAALSSKERVWTAVTVTTGALSGASGVTMIPVESHDATVALAAGVVVLSAATVGSLSMAQSYSRDWTREQCGQ